MSNYVDLKHLCAAQMKPYVTVKYKKIKNIIYIDQKLDIVVISVTVIAFLLLFSIFSLMPYCG